jgi:cytochrome c-type biogenesis protein
MDPNITVWAAVAGGVLSFFTPCVLPVIPAYLSLISGYTYDDLININNVKLARLKLFINAIAFVIGFSAVTILIIGGTASLISGVGHQVKDYIRYIGGGMIIIFGLHLLGVFQLKFLLYEKRFHVAKNSLGYLGSLLIGAAFAFGLTPCTTPILSSIFTIASLSDNPAGSWKFVIAFALGQAIPFLVFAIFINLILDKFAKLTRLVRIFEIITGVFLLLMGTLLVTNYLEIITRFVEKLLAK